MNQFYQTTHKGIKIIAPTKTLLTKMQKCLDLVVRKDKGLKTILITPTKGKGGAFYEKEKAYVVESGAITENRLVWEASCLLHEFRHAWQDKNWSQKDWDNWDKTEKDAYEVQRVFLCRADREDLVKYLDKRFEKKWWKKGGKNYCARDDVLTGWLKKHKAGELKIIKVS